MRVRRFLHILLFAGVLVLLWQVVATWSRPVPELVAASQDNPGGEPSLPSAPVVTPAIGKQLAMAISDKDLFSPSRSRTVEEVVLVKETIPPPSHLKLVGVFLTPKKEEALFVDSSQGGKVVRARKGETLGAYRLVQVAPLQVTLTMGQDGGEVSLPLSVLDSSTASKAPRLVPQGQRASPARTRQPPGAASAQAQQGNPPGGVPEEAGIRQDILRLQQRLRQIRRRAIREQRADGETGEEENSNEDEDEEEEEE